MILDRITKAKVIYRDISFQNMKVNENNEPIICDFNMAIESNGKTSGLREIMDIIKFMIINILNEKSYQTFYN